MMFGIGTASANLHKDAFINMLGEDDKSWGLSHKGTLWHNTECRYYTRAFRENVATTIGLHFDGVRGTLTYYKDGVNLGVAFRGLNEVKEPLYPIVCSTAAKTEMALGLMKRDFVSLQDRCRAVILRHLRSEEALEELCLPKSLKLFIGECFEDFKTDAQIKENNVHLQAS